MLGQDLERYRTLHEEFKPSVTAMTRLIGILFRRLQFSILIHDAAPP